MALTGKAKRKIKTVAGKLNKAPKAHAAIIGLNGS